MNIYNKLTLSFLVVTLVPTILLAFLTTTIIGKSRRNDAQESINNSLKAAWVQYYSRAYQVQYGMLQASTEEHIQNAIMRRDRAFLTGQLLKWKKYRDYVDIWTIVDADSRAIASLNTTASGQKLAIGGLVARSLETKEPVISTEVVSRETLLADGLAAAALVSVVETHAAAAPPGAPAPPASGGTGVDGEDAGKPAPTVTDGLVIFVITPVLDGDGEPVGAIVSGDLLNNDTYMPDVLAESLPGSLVAISLGGVQVSSNLVTESERRTIGQTLDAGLLRRINSADGFRGEAFMGGRFYITAFDPIVNQAGEVIGSLAVGLPKERFVELQYDNIKAIISVALIGLFMATGLGSIITYRITRPIKWLTRKAQLVATGDLSIHTSPLRDGGDEIADLSRTFAIMVEGLRENQTSIRTSQNKLASQKVLIESIINSLPYCLYVIERNMSIAVWNRHAARACPICNSSADCYNRNFINHLPNEELTEGLDEVIRSVFSTGAPRRLEQVLPRGSERPKDIHLRTTIFPILSEKGGPVEYVVWMAEDVTKSKEMEASVISSEKLAAVGQLAAGVAHEVNNPLGGILNFLYNFRSSNISEDRKAEYIGFMEEGIKRVQNIVRQLLDFSQQHEPELKLTDVNGMITGIVPLFQHMTRGKNVRLATSLGEGMPGILVDRHQLEQVLVNLILNAIQAVDGEGVIDISTRTENDRFCIEVSDDGVGMDSETGSRIFDPFFTTKGVGKGTGLGLSVSRGIVERHNGRIEMESAPGAGTSFKVYLPIPD
ncbi:MAG: ATP-binding protein [Thermodesulfobacteriota bacterium]